LRSLVAKRDWNELEEWSKTRKSPIGWEPFFTEILAAGNTKLAGSIVPKCTNISTAERLEMWVKCGMVTRAAEEALKSKDIGALESLRDKAQGAQVSEIERMMAQLKPR
jgi:hypothetical protein